MQNDDDDDICPVCESECTCGTKESHHVAQQPHQHQQPTPALKIRLTVPPKLLSSLQNSSRQQPVQTTSVSVQDGGVPFPTIPKKRGRPTKAEVEARRAAAIHLTSFEQEETARRGRRSHLSAPALKSSSQSVNSRQQPAKRGRPKKTQVTGTYRGSSTESDSDHTASTSIHGQSSTISSSDALGPGHESDSSELSSLLDPGDDSSLEDEEERYVIQEQNTAREKARVRREILRGGGGEQRRFDSHNRNSWEVRLPLRSAGLDAGGSTTSSSSSSTESDSEEDEGEDEEADADADEEEADAGSDNVGHIRLEGRASDFIGVTHSAWSDSDDEDFDADVFFASLSDSETSASGFDHVFEPQDDDSDGGSPSTPFATIPVEEAAAVGLISPLGKLHTLDSNATVLVTRDGNGQAIFSDGSDLVMGLLDIDFELNVVAQHSASSQAICDTTNNAAEEDEEMWIPSDEEFLDSDHGDTTDEDDAPLRGVQTPSGIVVFRFPTPPVFAIDPLSTLSPVPRRKTASAKRHKRIENLRKSSLPAPKPSEILARGGSSGLFADRQQILDDGKGDDAASVDGGSSSWSSVFRAPCMGQFETTGDASMRHVIINGENNSAIPSPLSHFQRVRRGSGSSRGRKRVAKRNESPFSAKRQCQSPLSSRSRSAEKPQSAPPSPPAEAPQPPVPIALDDVLDASFLDTTEDGEDKLGDAVKSYANRWDRVPMGAFRRMRNAGVSNVVQPVMEWSPHQPLPVSDGFCYGSPGGTLMRSGPLFNTSTTADWPVPSPMTTNDNSSPHLNVNSPDIPPMNDGDKTPTASKDVIFSFGNTPPESPTPKILSHKERRKEKRKQRTCLGPIPTLII